MSTKQIFLILSKLFLFHTFLEFTKTENTIRTCTSEKPIIIIIGDVKVPLKRGFNDGSNVIGIKQIILYSFALDKTLAHTTTK